MVSLVLPRLVSFEVARRSVSVAERNVAALKSAYWVVLVSGFFEPLLYLLSIGVGVGALIGDLTLPGGAVVTYAAFVAPAMLASSAMSGALSETTFNFFGKMKYMKLYDGILATPYGRSRSRSASWAGRCCAAPSTRPRSSPSWWRWI